MRKTNKQLEIEKLLKVKSSTAVVLYDHLIELEYCITEANEKIHKYTVSINNLNKKQETIIKEIKEIKHIMETQYEVNIDSLRVLKEL